MSEEEKRSWEKAIDELTRFYEEPEPIKGEQAEQLLRCALADLEGVMPDADPSGDRLHSGWTTIREIRTFLKMPTLEESEEAYGY